MRLGILTLHSGFNEGAVLQALCLSRHLKESLPAWKVEIIDLRYRSKTKAYGQPQNPRTRGLDNFINNALPLSTQTFIEDAHERAYDFIRRKYKALVIGSDEVWKLNYTRSGGFLRPSYEQKDPWCPAFPNAYWPGKDLDIPKVAYAACVGQMNWRVIPRHHRRKMREALSNFCLIGIRDSRTLEFLEWLDPSIAKRAEWVPDPTFSTDILGQVNTESIKEKLVKCGVNFSRPRLALVGSASTDTAGIIEDYRRKGHQIVAVSVSNNLADIDLSTQSFSPGEWFALFGQMSVCISVRMHACIACIHNGIPFIAVDALSDPRNKETKLKDLMRSLDLDSFHYRVGIDPPAKIGLIRDALMEGEWPIDSIRAKISSFRHRSEEFARKIRTHLGSV